MLKVVTQRDTGIGSRGSKFSVHCRLSCGGPGLKVLKRKVKLIRLQMNLQSLAFHVSYGYSPRLYRFCQPITPPTT